MPYSELVICYVYALVYDSNNQIGSVVTSTRDFKSRIFATKDHIIDFLKSNCELHPRSVVLEKMNQKTCYFLSPLTYEEGKFSFGSGLMLQVTPCGFLRCDHSEVCADEIFKDMMIY
jgi:hypothetical protein